MRLENNIEDSFNEEVESIKESVKNGRQSKAAHHSTEKRKNKNGISKDQKLKRAPRSKGSSKALGKNQSRAGVLLE